MWCLGFNLQARLSCLISDMNSGSSFALPSEEVSPGLASVKWLEELLAGGRSSDFSRNVDI